MPGCEFVIVSTKVRMYMVSYIEIVAYYISSIYLYEGMSATLFPEQYFIIMFMKSIMEISDIRTRHFLLTSSWPASI